MPERGGVAGTFLTPYSVSVASGTMRLNGQATGWFGPGAPMVSTVPDEIRGRALDLPAGYNLVNTPKAYEGINFPTLRALADGYDLLRLVIETRKDQVGRMRWQIKNRDGVKKDYAPAIRAITTFLSKPDGVTPWADWLRSVLEDLFVLDAPTLYLRRDRAGRLLALEQIDGGTIKRVIDDWGRTPQPMTAGGTVTYPVAYQQILKGMPLDYTARDLIYRPRNKRAHRVYGYAPVEQILTTVNIALRRQATTLEFFTDGTVPDAFISVPKEWATTQVREFQKYWDAFFEGSTALRRRAKFVPGDMKVQQTREPELKGEFDDWLARIVCFAFSVSPQALQRMMNRATAETAKQAAEEEGLAPILDWVEDLINDIIRDEFGFDDLEFAWQQDQAVDEAAQATILTTYTSKAVMTVNEARQKMGLDPDPNPAADKLMVLTATGYELLEANTIEGKQAMQDAFPQPDPPPDPAAGGGGAPPRPGTDGGGAPGMTGSGGRQSRGKAGGSVAKLAKADEDKPEPIDADAEEAVIVATLVPALDDTGSDLAYQVQIALDKAGHKPDSTADEIAAMVALILAGLAFGKIAESGLVTIVAAQLRSVAEAGATRGVSEATGGEPVVETAAAVSEAQADAQKRAAEMFGLRWVAAGGSADEKTLAADPGAQRSIVETMRAAVGEVVSKELADQTGAAAIGAAIKALPLFGKAHAATIAATEAMGVGNRALLSGYRASKLVLGKRWNITTEACKVCKINAAEGLVALNHVFASGDATSPAHPNCRCVMSCEPIPVAA